MKKIFNSKFILFITTLLLFSCSSDSGVIEEQVVEPSKFKASPLHLDVDLANKSLLILNSNDAQNPHLTVFTPSLNENCETNSVGELREGSILLLNKVESNILKIENVSSIPEEYSKFVSVSSTSAKKSGFKLLYQKSTGDIDVPIIHGEDDIRDMNALGGFGLNLNLNNAYIKFIDKKFLLYYHKSLTETKNCANQNEENLINFSNCVFCVDTISNDCYFTKCI